MPSCPAAVSHQVCDDSDTGANEQEVAELDAGVDLAAVDVEDGVQDDGGQHHCTGGTGGGGGGSGGATAAAVQAAAACS